MTLPTQSKEGLLRIQFTQWYTNQILDGETTSKDIADWWIPKFLSEKGASYQQGCKDTQEAMRQVLTED